MSSSTTSLSPPTLSPPVLLRYSKAEILQVRFIPASQAADSLDPVFSSRRLVRLLPGGSRPDQGQFRTPPSREEVQIQEAAKQTHARLTATRDEEEMLARDIKSTLNKLCTGNMQKLLTRLFDMARSQQRGSELLTSGIFDKACSEVKYTQLYASLCQGLEREFLQAGLVESNAHGHPLSLFKKAIIKNCQVLFESSTSETTEKTKVLGNVRFIGELYRTNLLGPKVLLECIRDLIDVQLRTLKRFSISELHLDEDRLEGVCLLIPIVMETSEVAPQVTNLLKLLQKVREDRVDISQRIKFLLLVRTT